MQLPFPAPHGWVGSQSEWHRESATSSPLPGKKRHSAPAPHASESSTHPAPIALEPAFLQNADFEVCVTPAASGACAVHVNAAGQSVPNGVHVAAHAPWPADNRTHEVFGSVQSA